MNVPIEGNALYHMEAFFEDTVTDNIFRVTDPTEAVTPANRADHTLRPAIDKLVDASPRTVLMAVFQDAMVEREGFVTTVLHGDVMTFSVQGMYDSVAEDADEASLDITYDHSKDKRRVLKQFTIGRVVNQTGVPIVGDSMDVNASERDWNHELVDVLRAWTGTDAPLIYPADSKVFPKDGQPL